MRRYLVICAVLLGGCGRDLPEVVAPPPVIPADLLRGCGGWAGPRPETEGEWVAAALAEMRGRYCANGKIEAIRQTVAAD